MESVASRAHVSPDAGPPPWTHPIVPTRPLSAQKQMDTQRAEVQDLRAHAESQGADLESVRIQTQALTTIPPDYDDGRQCPEDRRSPDDQGREAVMALFAYPRAQDAACRFYPGVTPERQKEISQARRDLTQLGKQFEDATKTQRDEVSEALKNCPKPPNVDDQQQR